MRIPIIAGNWKMHKSMIDTKDFLEKIGNFHVEGVEALLCVPYTNLIILKEASSEFIKIGSQNIHWEDSGAYTGEISPLMLSDLGVEYTIIGHSERRAMFAETDQMVNKKVHKALKHNIKPIICVGEDLSQKEAGETKEIVRNQVKKGLEGVTEKQLANIVIAYEPIWAIGTGKSSTAEDANEVIGFIRSTIMDLFSKEAANVIRIQYGGSVKPNNIREYMQQPEIDGALVGGASLEPESFKALVEGAK